MHPYECEQDTKKVHPTRKQKKIGIRSNFHSHILNKLYTLYIFPFFTFSFKLFILLFFVFCFFLSNESESNVSILEKNVRLSQEPCMKFLTWFMLLWHTTFSIRYAYKQHRKLSHTKQMYTHTYTVCLCEFSCKRKGN